MDAAESMTESLWSSAPDSSTESEDVGLSSREQEILAFEQQWWKYAGAKEQAIKETFGLSSTRYYQVLNQLLDNQEAMRTHPMLVKRLRKMRVTRQRNRAARQLGIELR
jgi:hypothetical protein